MLTIAWNWLPTLTSKPLLLPSFSFQINVFVFNSPSFSNFENCSRNLDMQELDYNPSKKDLTDAKIHHLLAEELKPYKRVSAAHSFLFHFYICDLFLSKASKRKEYNSQRKREVLWVELKIVIIRHDWKKDKKEKATRHTKSFLI